MVDTGPPRWGRCVLPEPGDDGIRLRGQRAGAAPLLRRLRARRVRHQVGHGRSPRSGRGTPRMAETPSGMLNSIGLQGPGIDAFVEKDLAVAEVGRGPGPGVDRRQHGRGVRRRRRARWRPARPSTRSSGSRSTSRAPTSPTAAWSSPATRCRRSGWCALVRERLPARHPDLRQADARRHRHRHDRARRAQGRRRRPDHDQHAARHGHRHRPAAAAARRRHRRALRPGRAAGRGAGAVAGHAPRCARGGCRRRRSSASGECAPAATRSSWSPPARQRRAGRHRHLQRPQRARRGSSTSSRPRSRGTGSHRFADVVGIAHERTARHDDGHRATTPRTAPGCGPRWTSSGRSAPASTRTPPCSRSGGCPTPWPGSRRSR